MVVCQSAGLTGERSTFAPCLSAGHAPGSCNRLEPTSRVKSRLFQVQCWEARLLLPRVQQPQDRAQHTNDDLHVCSLRYQKSNPPTRKAEYARTSAPQ